ncbi:MAG: hypothetical protein PUP93_13075, partial [Rhizonema sp. NSF051]|nr:hypothetical protein [Rhizonema sp. NSF051]
DVYNIQLTTLICLAKELVINLLIIYGNQRKPYSEDWIYYAYRNKQKYASQIVNRKIVIVSGSNALFGIGAKQIESSTGISTVNLGVNAGLGVDYILEQAKKRLKPGDIVLIPLEFQLYYQSKDQQMLANPLRDYIISYDNDYLNKLSLIDRLKVLLSPYGIEQEDIDVIKALLRNESPFDKKTVYSRILARLDTGECYTGMTLNRNGDETCNIGKSPIKNLKKQGKIQIDLKNPIDASGSLRDFCIFAKNHQITVIPLYPAALSYSDYKADNYKNYFDKIKRFWLQQNIPFDDSPSKSFLAEQMMFDSLYHPNDQGRNLRTKNIIDILRNYL